MGQREKLSFFLEERKTTTKTLPSLFSFCSFLHLKADLSFTVVLKLFTG